MSRYYVTWAMDIEDVETPLEAALACREIMLDPETTAVVFSVKNNETNETTEVDLWGCETLGIRIYAMKYHNTGS